MRLAAFSLLLLVACKPGGEGDDYYVEPGGGGGTFGTTPGMLPDAPGTGDAGPEITGRVCGLSEILHWSECDQSGLDGLIVNVGVRQTVTRDNGEFDIQTPSGSNLEWRVSGNDQFPSVREFPGDYIIPSISTDLYTNTAADAGVVPGNNVGTIFAQVTYMGTPVPDATAVLPGSSELVYYDDASGSAEFSVGATRADGIIWFPNVAPGTTVKFTVTPPVAIGTPKETSVVVEANSATFATVVFP